MRQTFGPLEWTQARTEDAVSVITALKEEVRHGRPWDEPAPAGRSELARSTSHRVPLGYTDTDIVESESCPGTYYHLRKHEDGSWSCDCPDYRCRPKGYCKHTVQRMERDAY